MKSLAKKLALLLSAIALPAWTPANVNSPGSLLDQAALAYSRGQWQQSVDLLKKIPGAEKSDSRALSLLGLSLRRLHRERDAIAPLERALKLNPHDTEAALNLGLCYFSEGLWDGAQKAFSSASEAAPKKPEPWMGLGMLQYARRDWEAAKQAYEKALLLDAKRSEAWLALSDTLIQMGKTRQAAEAREKAAGLLKDKDKDLHFKQAALWYGLDEIEKALKNFDASEAGAKPEALFLRGCLSYRQGDLSKAEDFFKAALEARPEYPEAELNLGISYYAREDFAAAIESFRNCKTMGGGETAEAYLKTSQEAAVERFLRQGSLAVLDQDFPKALESWEKARALDSDPAPIQKMIDSLRHEQAPQARSLALQGDEAFNQGGLEQALELWGQALEIDPKSPEALAGLKRAESRLDLLKDAISKSAATAAAGHDFKRASAFVERLRLLDAKAGKKAAADLKKSLDLEISSLEEASSSALADERFSLALSHLDSAIALDPARVRLVAKRNEVKGDLRKALAQKLSQATALESAGKAAEALKVLDEALALDSEDLEAQRMSARLGASLNISHAGAGQARKWYYEGVYAYGAGKTQAALDLWLKAQKAAPGNAQLAGAIRTARVKIKSLKSLEEKKR